MSSTQEKSAKKESDVIRCISCDRLVKKDSKCPHCNPPENYEKSYLVGGLKQIIRLCSKVSIHYIVTAKFRKLNRQEPSWIAEVYVGIFVLFITLGLLSMKYDYRISWVIVGAAIYRLIDIMVHVGRMIFIQSETIRNDNSPYILLKTRNPERWVILNFLNISEIVLSFAVLYFHWGNDFCERIDRPITAIYQSILTLTTLGYGEIHANGTASKLIVIFQLAYFIIFILLVAPRVFSSIRTGK